MEPKLRRLKPDRKIAVRGVIPLQRSLAPLQTR